MIGGFLLVMRLDVGIEMVLVSGLLHMTPKIMKVMMVVRVKSFCMALIICMDVDESN